MCHCLFFFDQAKGLEDVEGANVNEGVEIGGDGTRVEISARGASPAETASDDAEAEANVSTEALTTDAVAAPEV
jgi:hypothetical protein